MIQTNKQNLGGGRSKSIKNKKKKSKKKTLKKRIYTMSDKLSWSSDYFGEREVFDIKKYVSMKMVDNNNEPHGKLSKNVVDEYKRRLKIQLNHKPSKKRFLNKTRKKKQSIDKIIDNLSKKKLKQMYLYLQKKEKN